ncbi:hypothetical protein ACFPMF_26150 [Larkinella bovis]|uniref:DUF4136 domain-containing protein n=1 Tax=Larkinella bovis TaxID=683041 RepID=A0ABW0IIW3_9BACT
MKGLLIKGVFLLVAGSLASCDYQKYNSIRQKDYRAGDSYVYGPGLDSPAVQTTYKYASRPELADRTNKIRQKLFSQAH